MSDEASIWIVETEERSSCECCNCYQPDVEPRDPDSLVALADDDPIRDDLDDRPRLCDPCARNWQLEPLGGRSE